MRKAGPVAVSQLKYSRRGAGPPFVMIHGFLGGSGYWQPQFEHLVSDLDIVAPDLPGFATSGGLAACDSVEGFANAVVGLLDALGIEKFCLLGHSMGSMIAQQIALDFAPRVARLVLYGTAASGNLPERFEPFAESIRRIEEAGIDAAAQRVVASWFVAGQADPGYALCRKAGAGVTQAAAVAALKAIHGWDVRARLHEIRMPTLVINGDRDRSTSPREAFAVFSAIPGAQLCIVPNAAHAVHLEKPAFFNRICGEFIHQDRINRK